MMTTRQTSSQPIPFVRSIMYYRYSFAVHVYITCKPGTEEAFKEASLKNARQSALEAGVARFDVLQDQDDATQFVLVEVYRDADTAPAAHKDTTHYAEWRDTVADMMAAPRMARKFHNLFPTTSVGWEYPTDTTKLE
jgi:(4S)-4-hydroxy-5-phosphonooxypentane-2,3-dione isomerase